MHVLVVGGTGHAGPYLISDLVAAGHDVTALVRSDKSAETVSSLGATALHGSLDDLAGLSAAASASDGVIHVAHRQDLIPTGGINAVAAAEVEIMLAYGQALAGSGKPLVVSGSIGSPGWENLGRPATEEDPPLPGGDPYKNTLRVRNIVETTVLGLAKKGVRSSIVRIPEIMHSSTDNAGFLPLLIGLAKEKGVVGYPGDGANRWGAVHARDVATAFRLALEKSPAGRNWHAVAEGAIPYRQIAEAIAGRLNLPAVPIPTDVLMLPGYFGFLANLVTLDTPTSNAITRQTLGWEPTQPGLIEDLDNGHYFPAA